MVEWWRARAGPLLRWLTPGRRRGLLALAAVYEGIRRSLHEAKSQRAFWGAPDLLESALVVLVVFAVVYAVYRMAGRLATGPALARRHPQTLLHAGFWLLLALFWLLPPGAAGRLVLGSLVLTLPFLLWRLGYLLMAGARGSLAGTGVRDHLLYLFPVWGGSNTPYGKGLSYLARHEAGSEEALARSQLAGAKLLLLSLAWRVVLALLDALVHGRLGLPRFGSLLAGADVPLAVAWLGLYLELLRRVLALAASGHGIIGVLRLAGFNVFRNTYKPLLAESVVEFWNRFYYYFKELLVDFFFFPTFVRWFRGQPRLRLFTAVLASAFAGNMYYHLLQRDTLLVRGELAAAWASLDARLLYAFLLALGLYVSMRREQGRRGRPAPADGWRGRSRRRLAVWTFYGLIHIWGAPGAAGVGERTRFFLSLFGLG